jgi:hypothetical protein
MKSGKPAAVSALLLALAALFLGFFGAGKAYRADEVWSLRTISLPWDQMMAEIRGDIHPPLYYWLLDGWTDIAGETEIAARSLSVILYLATVVVAWFAARDLMDHRAAPVAAAIVAVSPLATLSARFVRMYALMTLAASVSTWMYLRLATRDPVDRRSLAVYAAVNTAGTFTHVWFFFLLLGQGLAHLALFRTRRLPRLIVAAALSLGPYVILWLPVLLAQVRKTQSALAWVPKPALPALAESLWLWGGGFWLTVPVLVIIAWRRGTAGIARPAVSPWIPAVIALITLLAPFLISEFKPVFWPRFTVVALPAFALAAAGWTVMAGVKHLDKAILLLGAGLLAGAGQYDSECDSRSGAAILRARTKPGDWVVFSSLSRPPIEYYLERSGAAKSLRLQSFPVEIDAHPGHEGEIHTEAARPRLMAEAAQLAETFREAGPDGARLYFVHGFRPKTDAIPLEQFERRLSRDRTPAMKCASMGGYFDRIDVFQRE